VHAAPTPSPISYKRHRFPAEIISHWVWLYHRCGLRLRDVQELLAERGVAVTYETIHQWCRTFGPACAPALMVARTHPA
jgi:putative transposase